MPLETSSENSTTDRLYAGMAEEDRQPLQLRDLDEHEAEARSRRSRARWGAAPSEIDRVPARRSSGRTMQAAVISVTVASSTPSTPTAFMLNETMPWSRQRCRLKTSRRRSMWKKNGLSSVGALMSSG